VSQAVFPRRAPLRIQAARIGGVEIPNQKYVEYSLQYIFGIGHTTAKAILASTGVENKRTKVGGVGVGGSRSGCLYQGNGGWKLTAADVWQLGIQQGSIGQLAYQLCGQASAAAAMDPVQPPAQGDGLGCWQHRQWVLSMPLVAARQRNDSIIRGGMTQASPQVMLSVAQHRHDSWHGHPAGTFRVPTKVSAGP
jgi:hypothetical protein